MSTRSPSPEISSLTLNADLTPLPVYKPAGTLHLSFSDLLSPPLQLHEDLSTGCGGQSWPAGMLLARHILLHHRHDWGHAKILELGAGGGLVGLAVALGCTNVTEKIYVTDLMEMLPLMKRNIALNGLESRVVPLLLKWGDPLPSAILDSPPTHILAADCVYFEPAFPLLLATLNALLTLNPAALVLFCFMKRRRADMQFMKKARKMFIIEEIKDEERKTWEREGLWLYVFKRRVSQGDSTESMENVR